MVKKYTDNYRLDIAYATIFRNINAIEDIPIHTALNITSGDNLTKKDMVAGAHIVYGGGGVTVNTHTKYNIDYKTIGIGRVGARCGCVFEIKPNSWVTDNALIIQSFDRRLSLNFLRHFLSYSDLGQYANNAMQPVISKTRIKHVAIPLIDIEEQNVLSKILDSIENNEKFENHDYNLLISKIGIIDNWEILNEEIEIQKELASNLKQSILQEAIQGELTVDWREQNPNTESASELLKRIKEEKTQLIKDKKIKKEKALPAIKEEDIHFELPEGWTWCRLGDLVHISSGDGLTAKQMVAGDIPVFGGNGINGYHNKFNTSEKTVTIGRVGAYCGAVHLTPQFAWITDNCFRVYFDRKSISQAYLIWHLKYMNLGKASYDGSQPVISGKRVYPLLTFLPPFQEQKAIVEKVEALMQKCQVLEQKINASETNAQILMQAVLKEVFEGEKEKVER